MLQSQLALWLMVQWVGHGWTSDDFFFMEYQGISYAGLREATILANQDTSESRGIAI